MSRIHRWRFRIKEIIFADKKASQNLNSHGSPRKAYDSWAIMGRIYKWLCTARATVFSECPISKAAGMVSIRFKMIKNYRKKFKLYFLTMPRSKMLIFWKCSIQMLHHSCINQYRGRSLGHWSCLEWDTVMWFNQSPSKLGRRCSVKFINFG